MTNSRSSSSASSGIGICGATFLVFLVLKLTGYIDWSWWVTAPLWGPCAAVIAIVFAAGAVYLLFVTCRLIFRRIKRASKKDSGRALR